MKASFLKANGERSPLRDTQLASGGRSGKKHVRELAIALPLTSLIDAFAIIVIYLLIGTQSGGLEVPLPNQMQLPSAQAGQAIEKETTIIQVRDNQYFVNNEPVSIKTLGAKLFNVKTSLKAGEEMEVLIQADRQLEYDQLSPLLKSTAEAGIQKIKFAVMTQK